MKKKVLYIVGAIIGVAMLVAASVYGYMYVSTPAHIRQPGFDHYHFRTQMIVDGKQVDFSQNKFQQPYERGSCSAEINGTPIDFHDNRDQMTHIHWDGMTGGEFLKYYGWNVVGGSDNTMGYRFDQGPMNIHKVERFGDALPAMPENANYYVYIGDENGYTQKKWDDFLKQDLETFFGKQSNLGQGESASIIDKLDIFSTKAYAHGGANDGHDTGGGEGEKSQEELARINNLVGNVVIFVQPNEPSDEEIKAKFNNLMPLHDSTCGG